METLQRIFLGNAVIAEILQEPYVFPQSCSKMIKDSHEA